MPFGRAVLRGRVSLFSKEELEVEQEINKFLERGHGPRRERFALAVLGNAIPIGGRYLQVLLALGLKNDTTGPNITNELIY